MLYLLQELVLELQYDAVLSFNIFVTFSLFGEMEKFVYSNKRTILNNFGLKRVNTSTSCAFNCNILSIRF